MTEEYELSTYDGHELNYNQIIQFKQLGIGVKIK
jgi:hypothetical protein